MTTYATLDAVRKLQLFEDRCEDVVLLAPNRFVVMPCKRTCIKEKKKRVGWKYKKIGYAVIGTLNENFPENERLSMRDIKCLRMNLLDDNEKDFNGVNCDETELRELKDVERFPIGEVPDVDDIMSQECAARFMLNRKQVHLLKKMVRIDTKAKNARKKSPIRSVKLDASETEVRLATPGTNAKSAYGGLEYRLKISARISAPFVFMLPVEMLRAIPADDYEVTVLCAGILEMHSIESGLTFLFRMQIPPAH